MLKRLAVVVLLGFLCPVAGAAFSALFPRPQSYYVDAGLLLPAHGPHAASDLTLMTRGSHPGVRVVAFGERHIGFYATGSLAGTKRAVNLAVRQVIAANDGKVERSWDGLVFRVPRSGYGLSGYALIGYAVIGLLVGLGTVLSFPLIKRRLVAWLRLACLTSH